MSLPATRLPRRRARVDAALIGVAGVLTVSSPLEDVLAELVDWSRVAVASDACTLLVRLEGSDDLVRATDTAVHSLTADGVTDLPSPLAETLAAPGTANVSGIRTDPRWPDFGLRAGEAALRSLVTTAVVVDDHTTALLTHWSASDDGFTPADVTDAAEFASHLAPVLHNAVAASELRRRNENLLQALTSRAVIDQAIGIVMSRTGSSADQAFHRMRAISQRERVKVHEVAHRTVRDAVNRTRARMLQSNEPVADLTARSA